MEYAAGGELFEYIAEAEQLPEDTARWAGAAGLPISCMAVNCWKVEGLVMLRLRQGSARGGHAR